MHPFFSIPVTTKQRHTILKTATYAKVQDRLSKPNKGYIKFSVEKKNGKKRWIHAPHYIVKSAQQTVLKNLPSPSVKQYGHEVITGFIPGLSILDNARPHVGKRVVLSVDLKNFFPSFLPTDIDRLLRNTLADLNVPGTLPYDAVDSLVSLVTTGKKRLPQGAPTSPMLANWLCVDGDRQLVDFCTEHKLAYTRYADDLTFSSFRDIDQDVVDDLFSLINSGIFGSKVKIAPNKIKFMRRHKQQRVTGIVVNEKMSIPRARRKQLRAFMHDCEINGVKAAMSRYNNTPQTIFGEFSFLHLAHQDKATTYIEKFKELL